MLAHTDLHPSPRRGQSPVKTKQRAGLTVAAGVSRGTVRQEGREGGRERKEDKLSSFVCSDADNSVCVCRLFK